MPEGHAVKRKIPRDLSTVIALAKLINQVMLVERKPCREDSFGARKPSEDWSGSFRYFP